MSITIVDALIFILIILGGIVGYRNGAIKEGTQFIGLFIISIIAFILKDNLMVIMYENLPFFKFFGLIEGIDAINILFYQLLSFIIIFLALLFALKVLIVVTGLVEWLLKLTVFFEKPSKIIGVFVGILEFYVYIFIALYILNMPIFNLSFVNNSKFGNIILNNTPVLSDMANDTVEVYTDVYNIIKNKDNKTNGEVNTLVLSTLLDNKLITIDSAKKLVESNKIIITDKSILDTYQDNGNFYEEIKNKYGIGE